MDLEPIGSHDAVRSEVLALEVRVDRHVKLGSASTDRRHEVDRGNAASLPDQIDGVGGDEELHGVLSAIRLLVFSLSEPSHDRSSFPQIAPKGV